MRKFSEFVNDFLNIFQCLSKFEKKVFKYLQWFSKKFRCVFPCLQKIANALGCCVRTVTRATARFQQLGWLFKKKRGYQSNLYFMNEELISLDLSDESIFFREECPQNVHVLRSSSSESIYTCLEKKTVSISLEMEDRTVPQCVKIACLSPQDQQLLANEFSEYALVQSVKDAKWYSRAGNKIRDYVKIIWWGAKRYS